MEIHYADKAYRKRSLWMFAAIMLLCCVLLWQLHAWLQSVMSHLIASDPDTVRRWLRLLVSGLGLALAVPSALLGLSLRKLAYTSRLQGRFPPREWKTLRDVRVLRDGAALDWARRVERTGTGALVLAGMLAGWAIWAWWRFG